MKILELPKMSTLKPFKKHMHSENGQCFNHLKQDFNPKAPDTVWASDFTYIKVNGKHCSCLHGIHVLYSSFRLI